MKNISLLPVLVGLALALSSGCASLRTNAVYERSSETKIIVIQERIEDGLEAGSLTKDQSRMYLDTLKDIRADYTGIKDKSVSRDERNRLQGRLDVLGNIIKRALTPVKKIGEPEDSFWEQVGRAVGALPQTEKTKAPTMGDRIITLQRRIDDGRSSGAFSLKQGRDFQATMDYIRHEYFRMMGGGRSITLEEKKIVSYMLDSMEMDLNLVPRL